MNHDQPDPVLESLLVKTRGETEQREKPAKVEAANGKMEGLEAGMLQSKASALLHSGETFYSALSGNTEKFITAYKAAIDDQIRRNELYAQARELDKEQGRDIGNTVLESVQKSVDGLRSLKASLDNPSEVTSLMNRGRENLNNGYGAKLPGGFVDLPRVLEQDKITSANNIPHFLRDAHDRMFDTRKKAGDYTYANIDNGESTTARGVGLAALESGDFGTASSALAFAEAVEPLPRDVSERITSLLGKLDDSKRQGFEEKFMVATGQQRNYKKEIDEARSGRVL